MDKVVALAKRRGFIFPSSEIYGGLAGFWDYGPVGSLLKKNIKDLWWKNIVQERDDIVGLDASVIMNPKVWEASGHVEAFTDPLFECKKCHKRFRADTYERFMSAVPPNVGSVAPKKEYLDAFICSDKKPHERALLIGPRVFNLLTEVLLGVTEPKQKAYLRGEITQGVFVNFKNVVDSTRVKIPFGIAQIGKAFRNEITPGNFTFRSREFEQMEIQYFVEPDEEKSLEQFEYWKKFWMKWYVDLGINKDNLQFKPHADNERAHYAKAATDIEYNAPWGWAEFMGIHHRGDWDLSRHEKHSGKPITYRDPHSGKEYTPWDIESSAGVDRSFLFFLIEAFHEDKDRIVLKLHPKLAPYKVAVFPLVANKQNLVDTAREIYDNVKKDYVSAWDDRGNIGKRYAAQDEIGTPFCVTVDYQTLEDGTVTVRHRDTAKQERISKDALSDYLAKYLL